MRDAPTARLALGALWLLGCSDTTPPRFDEGAAPALRAEGDRVEVSWPEATDDRQVTTYVVEIDGAEVARGPGRSHTLTGVPELASLRVAIRALDAAGHASEPITAQITLADRTPPRFPPEARVEQAPSETAPEVTLTWTGASDNVAVVSYEVRRDGVLVDTTEQPRLERFALPPRSVIEIVAIDAQGLRSQPLEGRGLEPHEELAQGHEPALAPDEARRHAEQDRALERARAELAERSGADIARLLEAGEASTNAFYGASAVETVGAPREGGAAE